MCIYERVAFCAAYHLQDMGGVVRFLAARSREFYLFLYPPSAGNRPAVLRRYRDGVVAEELTLFWYKGSHKGVIHLMYYVYYLYFLLRFRVRRAYVITYYPLFLVFSSLFGLLLGNQMVFWIWDHFPDSGGLMSVYNRLVRLYSGRLDHVLFLSPALREIYGGAGGAEGRAWTKRTVSFGVPGEPVERAPEKGRLGFIGYLRDGQGFEVLFEALRRDGSLSLDVVGDGALRGELEARARREGLDGRVRFLGFVEQGELPGIVARWEMALAPYDPSPGNMSVYADPSKVKTYVRYELPVVMTRVTHFHREVEAFGAGVTVDYDAGSLLDGIRAVSLAPAAFAEGVVRLKAACSAERVYRDGFSFMEAETRC